MQTLDDTSNVMEQVLDRSAHQRSTEDQTPLVRGNPVLVLPPGYPLRTFVLHQFDQPEDAEDALADAAENVVHAQPRSDHGHLDRWPAHWRARGAVSRFGSMGVRGVICVWARVRSHGTWSLCGCLALLLLTQVGAVSLLALQTQAPALSSSAQPVRSEFAPDPSVMRSRPMPLLERALAEAAAGIPTATASSTPAGADPAPPPGISDRLSSDLGANYNTIGQPCHGSTFFVATITPWAVPPGCFAKIYSPNPKNYPAVSGAFGWCNWWPEVLHPTHTDLLTNGTYRQGSTPVPGAAIHFAPGVQGASSAGHYAQVVAVQPGSPWILVTEMNFTWRGGGFGKVDYRYVKVGAGMTFSYDS